MNRSPVPAGSKWWRGLRSALARMRLERRGFKLRFVREAAASTPAKRPAAPLRRGQDALPPMPKSQLADAHADLKSILDNEPELRRLRPTLALLERALDKDCESGIDQIPAAVLRHAAQSLDQLQDECFSPGLVVLRRRVAVVLRRKHAGMLLQQVQGPREERQPDFSNTLTEFVDLDSPFDEPPRRASRVD